MVHEQVAHPWCRILMLHVPRVTCTPTCATRPHSEHAYARIVIMPIERSSHHVLLFSRMQVPGGSSMHSPRPSTQELHFAAVARRDAAVAERNAATRDLKLRATRSAAPSLAPASSLFVAAPPSAEDLYALYQLCGGSRSEVVSLLARLWGAAPAVIAPSVHSWLVQLPPIPVPSRTFSAPPALSVALAERLRRATPLVGRRGLTLVRGTLRYADARDAPAASAPACHTESHLTGALSGLHAASTRLSKVAPAPGEQVSGGIAQVYALPPGPTLFAPVRLTAAQVAAVPEAAMPGAEGESDGGDGDALDRFLVMHKRLHAELSPAVKLNSSARMRF